MSFEFFDRPTHFAACARRTVQILLLTVYPYTSFTSLSLDLLRVSSQLLK